MTAWVLALGNEAEQDIAHMQTALSHLGHGGWHHHYWPGGALAIRAWKHEVVNWYHASSDSHAGGWALLVGKLFANATNTAALSAEACWQCWNGRGPHSMKDLRGNGLLIVADHQGVHCLRDRAGHHSLSWFHDQQAGRCLASAEPKAILAVPAVPRQLRLAGLAQYLSYGFLPGVETMLQDIHQLPPGHVLSMQPKHCTHAAWFTIDPAKDDHNETTVWTQELRHIVDSSIRHDLPGSQDPALVALSGGLDSSIVASRVAALHQGPVHSFAIHFGPKLPNELAFAAEAAAKAGTIHHEIRIEPKGFLPRLRQTIAHLDVPIGDPITVPNAELARRLSAYGDRIFNGEGGDPLFGGPKNGPMLISQWYGDERDICDRYVSSYKRAYEDLDGLLTPEAQQAYNKERDLFAPVRHYLQNERYQGLLDRLVAINTQLKGAQLILPKVARMYGMHGMAPASPLFDDRLIDLSFAMPGTGRLRAGSEKNILKQAYADDVPQSIIDRPKSGMRVPLHWWFQGSMRRYAKKILSKRAIESAGIFRYERLQRYLRYDTGGRVSRPGLRLWMIMTFEIWRRLIIEREAI